VLCVGHATKKVIRKVCIAGGEGAESGTSPGGRRLTGWAAAAAAAASDELQLGIFGAGGAAGGAALAILFGGKMFLYDTQQKTRRDRAGPNVEPANRTKSDRMAKTQKHWDSER